MAYWSLVVIVLSLIAMLLFALKGTKIFLLAPIAAIMVALLSGENILASFTSTYMTGFGNYIISNLPIFMTGALLGFLMDKSGYAQSIAYWIVKKIGSKRAILTIVLATAILCYGGVSLFVVTFTVYPIAADVFRKSNIPKRLIPAVIGLGAFGFATYCLPGSPQVQNAMFMPFYGTTMYPAPVLGVIGAVVEFSFGMWWLSRRQKKLQAAGEGYGDHVETLSKFDTENLPSPIKAFSPIIIFFALNLLLTYVIFPAMTMPTLEEKFGITLGSVKGTWGLVVALVIASLVIIFQNLKPFKGRISAYLAQGIENSITPITNTAAVIGYGAVIRNMAGFAIVSSLLLGISANPLIAEAISINVLSGITGSASGGIGITLNAFAEQFIEMAENVGISMEVMHRIGLVASSGLDSLPHNGAIITTLAVCGLTHKESYFDMFMTTVVEALIATVILIVLATAGIQC